jgi:hypothetical protein
VLSRSATSLPVFDRWKKNLIAIQDNVQFFKRLLSRGVSLSNIGFGRKIRAVILIKETITQYKDKDK